LSRTIEDRFHPLRPRIAVGLAFVVVPVFERPERHR
jgi:hypothetical protein